MKNAFIFLFLSSVVLGCGVRGDPIPPGAPTELGHGYPSYKDPANRMTPSPLPSKAEIKKKDAEDEAEDH